MHIAYLMHFPQLLMPELTIYNVLLTAYSFLQSINHYLLSLC